MTIRTAVEVDKAIQKLVDLNYDVIEQLAQQLIINQFQLELNELIDETNANNISKEQIEDRLSNVKLHTLEVAEGLISKLKVDLLEQIKYVNVDYAVNTIVYSKTIDDELEDIVATINIK